MSENELYYNTILKKIVSSLDSVNAKFTFSELLDINHEIENYSETDIMKALIWGVSQDLITLEYQKDNQERLFIFHKLDWKYKIIDEAEIAISGPHVYNLTIRNILERNNFITTKAAFEKILLSGDRIIRISSPFFEKNITNQSGMEHFENILKIKLNSGCKIIILTREVHKRSKDFNWLIDVAKNSNFPHNLEIYDFHMINNDMIIDSSLHAKLIIADQSMAYLGSAELRFNSVYKNFEAGIVISGASVQGIVELFESIIAISKKVY